MRFEVLQPRGQPHVVEFAGQLLTLGRDPGCDLVLNDIKCSRRHAVIELTKDGLQIRDTASSNGVYVNGEKRERVALASGDEVSLGDVRLRVLEPSESGASERGGRTPEWPPLLGPTSEQSRPASLERGSSERPEGVSSAPARALTLDLLVALWSLSAVIYGVGGIFLAVTLRRSLVLSVAIGAATFTATVLSIALAVGLATRRRWARLLQIIVAAFGLLNCPFTLASILVLVYMLRGETAQRFATAGDRSAIRSAMDGTSEIVFSVGLAGLTLLGGVLCALAAWLHHSAPPAL
jgi:hypothetical protein